MSDRVESGDHQVPQTTQRHSETMAQRFTESSLLAYIYEQDGNLSAQLLNQLQVEQVDIPLHDILHGLIIRRLVNQIGTGFVITPTGLLFVTHQLT